MGKGFRSHSVAEKGGGVIGDNIKEREIELRLPKYVLYDSHSLVILCATDEWDTVKDYMNNRQLRDSCMNEIEKLTKKITEVQELNIWTQKSNTWIGGPRWLSTTLTREVENEPL